MDIFRIELFLLSIFINAVMVLSKDTENPGRGTLDVLKNQRLDLTVSVFSVLLLIYVGLAIYIYKPRHHVQYQTRHRQLINEDLVLD